MGYNSIFSTRLKFRFLKCSIHMNFKFSKFKPIPTRDGLQFKILNRVEYLTGYNPKISFLVEIGLMFTILEIYLNFNRIRLISKEIEKTLCKIDYFKKIDFHNQIPLYQIPNKIPLFVRAFNLKLF
jgi:hypothetical protein